MQFLTCFNSCSSNFPLCLAAQAAPETLAKELRLVTPKDTGSKLLLRRVCV